MKLDPRIPKPVQPILKDYVQLSEQRLISLVESVLSPGGN